jgi:PKD domain-containing protein
MASGGLPLAHFVGPPEPNRKVYQPGLRLFWGAMPPRALRRFVPAVALAVVLLMFVSLLVPAVGFGSDDRTSRPAGPAAGGTARSGTVSPVPSGSRRAPATDQITPSATIVLGSNGGTPSVQSLEWTDPNNGFFSQYAVAESTNGSGGPWATVGVITTESTVQFAVPSLSPGATYWWEVVETYGYYGQNSLASNVVNTTQPTLAYLAATGVTSTSASFHWTNNASYGGLLSFASYEMFESVNGTPPGLAATVSDVGTLNYTVTDLSTGTGYTFYLVTSDCYAECGTGSASLSPTQSNSLPLGTALPLVASLSTFRTEVDVGQLVSFTCTPSGGVAPYFVSWNFGNGTFAPGNGTASTIFSTPGAPVVACEVRDSSSSESTAGTTLLVNARPGLSISLNRTSADVGEPVNFSCTTFNGTDPFEVGWTFGDASGSTQLNVTHAYAAAGTMVVTCSGADGAGVRVAASTSVKVSSPLEVLASVNSAAVAPGVLLSFVGTAANGSGNYTSYAWSFGDGTSATGTSVTHAFAAAGAFTIRLKVLDSNGIPATGTVEVTVAPLAVTILDDPTSATAGSATTFAASAVGGAGGPYNFTWNFGDGRTAYGTSVSHVYSATGTYHPVLEVTDRLGAQNTTAIASVGVAAAPGPWSWVSPAVVLAIAVTLGALLALILYSRRRSQEVNEGDRMSGYAPPAGPSSTVGGTKVCAHCETPNLPIRNTCVACGKPLPRAASH